MNDRIKKALSIASVILCLLSITLWKEYNKSQEMEERNRPMRDFKKQLDEINKNLGIDNTVNLDSLLKAQNKWLDSMKNSKK